MKPGRSLEKLVEHLERMLTATNEVSVESPSRLRDQFTGRLREHDVILTFTEAHHTIRTAVECRDRSRPIDNGQVEAFWAKCQFTGVDQGVIVSARGFYQTALKKAQALKIRCLSLEEASSVDWSLAKGVLTIMRKLAHTNWIIKVDKEYVPELQAQFTLVDLEGEPIPQEALNRVVSTALNNVIAERPTVQLRDLSAQKTTFVFEGDSVLLRDDASGKLFPVRELMAEAQWEVVQEYRPLRLFKYSDQDRQITIAQAAVAQLQFGETPMTLVAVTKDEKQVRLSLTVGTKLIEDVSEGRPSS